MATVTKETKSGRSGYRVRFYVEGRRRELYVAGGSIKSQKRAATMAQHLEELASAIKKNIPPARDAVAWAAGTTGKLRENLVAWGLAEPINPKLMTDEGRLLGPFLDAYIASRTDAKPNTIRNYKQVRRLLCEHFGERCPINSITPSAADKWRRWMLARPLAQSSVSKHTKRAKTMLAEAVRSAVG